VLAKQEPKYDCSPDGRIVNRSTNVAIPDDEPILILRAQDRNAVGALIFYMHNCDNPDHRAVVKSRIQDFQAFAEANPDRMKEPDSSLQDLAGANIGRAPFTAAARTAETQE
jgi:hypothetical protein